MSTRSTADLALIVGGPVALALVELFHPHPHDLLRLDVGTWLAVRYAQIPLFALAALSVTALIADVHGAAEAFCRKLGWSAPNATLLRRRVP
jgi:hypothetical protein